MYGPTGAGQTVNPLDAAGVEPPVLPPRPVRAKQHDAARKFGPSVVPDNSAAGDTDMCARSLY